MGKTLHPWDRSGSTCQWHVRWLHDSPASSSSSSLSSNGTLSGLTPIAFSSSYFDSPAVEITYTEGKKMARTRFCHFLPFKLTYKRVNLEVQCRFLCRLHPLPHKKVLVTYWLGKQIDCTDEILLPITNSTIVLFYKVNKLLTLQQNQ